jgi:hypothetical protein
VHCKKLIQNRKAVSVEGRVAAFVEALFVHLVGLEHGVLSAWHEILRYHDHGFESAEEEEEEGLGVFNLD